MSRAIVVNTCELRIGLHIEADNEDTLQIALKRIVEDRSMQRSSGATAAGEYEVRDVSIRAVPMDPSDYPVDDEPVTDSDRAAIAEANADIAAGRMHLRYKPRDLRDAHDRVAEVGHRTDGQASGVAMKPSVGRIVHYWHENWGNGFKPIAGLVTDSEDSEKTIEIEAFFPGGSSNRVTACMGAPGIHGTWSWP